MPVYANSGGGLGAGLLAFGNSYLGAKRQARQDDLFEEQLKNSIYQNAVQRAQNEANGLHILAPGELPPPDVARNMVDYAGQKANAATPDNIINSSLSFSPQGGAPTLSRAGAGKANIPGQSGSFMDRMSAMVGQQPDRGAQYQSGKGYYIDKAPQWQAADAARATSMSDAFEKTLMGQMVAQEERDRKIRGYVAAGVDPARAALYAENAALAENDPKIGKPQGPLMGSPEWLTAQTELEKVKNKYGYHAPPTPPTNVYLPSYDPATGQTTYSVAPSKGPVSITPTSVVKPPTASATTKATATNKEKSYVDLMGQSLPTMQKLSDAVRPEHIAMAIKYPMAGNLALNQDEQAYMQAARNFLAGVLHEESGARLSNEQWQIGLQRFFPAPGDSKETKRLKLNAAAQLFSDRQKLVAPPSGLPGGGRGSFVPNDPGGNIDLRDSTAGVNPWRRP